MTDTMVHSAVLEDTVNAVACPVGPLRAMLTGTLTSVSTDVTLPTLCTVMVTVGDGRIRMQSTDRYRAVMVEYVVPDGFMVTGTWSALIDRKDVRQILSALPKGKGTELLPVSISPVAVSPGSGAVVFDWGTGLITVDAQHGDHPKLASLVPSDDAELGLPSGVMHLNGDYLATLAAIPTTRNQPWKVQFHGDAKPMVATCAVDGDPSWLFLLMPVRIT